MSAVKHYKLKKVAWVVVLINVTLLGVSLLIIYNVKVPGQNYSINDFFSLKSFIQQTLSCIYYVIFYYFSLNKLYTLMLLRKPTKDYVKLIGFLFIITFTYHIVSGYALSPFKEKQPWGLMLVSCIISVAIMLCISLLIAYMDVLRGEKNRRKILEKQKIQLEVEKLQANYNYLKSQINPHFLHNTLNFFYAKSLPYSQELSDGILTLSDIMRYAMSQDNAVDKVLLSDEIEHLRNVIKINQLRFSNNLNVSLTVTGVVTGITIIPFVLITIVENAFKHGELKNQEHPIDMQLTIEDTGQVSFYCKNKKKTGPKELSTGIGLDNTQKRLKMAYENKFKLNIIDEQEFYTIQLILLP
ncbi:sensor histidine kinase [Chitinophagaceae bacterium LWZ2-11]